MLFMATIHSGSNTAHNGVQLAHDLSRLPETVPTWEVALFHNSRLNKTQHAADFSARLELLDLIVRTQRSTLSQFTAVCNTPHFTVAFSARSQLLNLTVQRITVGGKKKVLFFHNSLPSETQHTFELDTHLQLDLTLPLYASQLGTAVLFLSFSDTTIRNRQLK